MYSHFFPFDALLCKVVEIALKPKLHVFFTDEGFKVAEELEPFFIGDFRGGVIGVQFSCVWSEG